LSWNGKQVDEDTLGRAIDYWVYQSPDAQIGKALLNIGKLDQVMDSYIPNSSMHWTLLFGFHEERFREFFKEHTNTEKLYQGLEYVNHVEGRISSSSSDLWVRHSTEELRLGLRMTRVALERGIAYERGKEFAIANREEIESEFNKLWKVRARDGGLREASKLLRDALV
jgi:hypothetical protein